MYRTVFFVSGLDICVVLVLLHGYNCVTSVSEESVLPLSLSSFAFCSACRVFISAMFRSTCYITHCEPERRAQADKPQIHDSLACFLSARADTHRTEEYTSRPAEKARSTTGNREGKRATSPKGAALKLVV